MSVFETDIDFT